MVQIKLTQGAYRYRPEGSKSAVVVQLGDPPFDLPAAEAARLVGLGVAEYTTAGVATAQIQAQGETTGEPPHKEEEAINAPSLPLEDIPKYSVKMTSRELTQLMEKCNLEIPEGMTKRQMVEELDFYFDTGEDFVSDEEGAPDLKAGSVIL